MFFCQNILNNKKTRAFFGIVKRNEKIIKNNSINKFNNNLKTIFHMLLRSL